MASVNHHRDVSDSARRVCYVKVRRPAYNHRVRWFLCANDIRKMSNRFYLDTADTGVRRGGNRVSQQRGAMSDVYVLTQHFRETIFFFAKLLTTER